MNPKALLTFALLSSAASAADWSLTPLVLEGQTVPNGNTVTSITNLAINNKLEWRVEAGSTTGTASQNLLLDANGIVAEAGQALSAPPGAMLRSFDALTLDINGNSAVNFFLDGTTGSSDDSGVYYNFNLLIQESQLVNAAGISAGTPYIGFFETKLADNGAIVLLASIDDPAIAGSVDQVMMGLIVDGSGNLVAEVPLWKEGDTIPGTTGLITTFGTGPHNFDMNDAGTLMFFADTDLASTMDGVIMLNNALLAQEGTPSPVAGRNWSSLSSPELSLNNSGGYVYSGSLDGDSASNLVIIKDGVKFMQEGDAVPGIPAFAFTSFGSGPLDLADNGDLVWFGDWNDPDTTVDTGLFVNEELIVQEGVTQIGGVIVDSLSGVQEGYFISDDGRFVIFEATLLDGTNGAFLATRNGSITSIPGCSPDGSTLTHVGGTASIGDTLQLMYASPSMATGLRFLAVAGMSSIDGSGCGINFPGIGEALVGLVPPNPLLLPMGVYTGSAATLPVSVPNNVSLIGMTRYLQAVFVYPGDPLNTYDLSNALEVTVGL